jgi:hypothetical protein
MRARLHVRFGVRIAIRFCVQLPAYFNFQPIFPDMCRQAVAIDFRRIIESLNTLYANRARNRTRDSYAKSDSCSPDGTLFEASQNRGRGTQKAHKKAQMGCLSDF